MAASILIIGPAGRLRDGLCTILRTFPSITEITAADNFELAYALAAKRRPAAIIVDGDSYKEDDCLLLKKLLSQTGQCCCLAIANTMQQAVKAMQVGADAVLLQGFSTSSLHQTLVSLNIVPESETAVEPAASSWQKTAAAPLVLKS